MTAFRLAIVAAMVAAILAACGQSEDPITSSGASNTLLDYVPSDTPYLAANLEPLPDDVIDVYLERMRPALEEMQAQLAATRADLEGQPGNDDARLALAFLRELDGNLSRAGLSALGLDILAPKVVYGLACRAAHKL